MAKTQREKFEEAVRKLGIEDAEEAFEAAVQKVAKAPKLSDGEIKALARELREKARSPS